MNARPLAFVATAGLAFSLMAAGPSHAVDVSTPNAAPIDSLLDVSRVTANPSAGHTSMTHALHERDEFVRSTQTAQTAPVMRARAVADATVTVPCGPNAGAALQAAVDAAASGDTINLTARCVYNISTPDPTSTDSALYVNKTLTINGRNATIARAASASSDFRVLRIDGPGNLTLTNATVTGGMSIIPDTDGNGGGIEMNSGATLNLTASTVTGNTSYEGGGGIANYGGTLTVNSSTISNNRTSNGGGGLEQGYGSAAFTSSRIMDNTADSNLFGFVAAGGGAVRMIDPGTLTLNSTILSGNAVLNNYTFGGAIENIYGTVTVNSSPIRNNRASGSTARGGAFSNLEFLAVNYSPISGNVANGTDSGGFGGGLSENGGSATFTGSPVTTNTAGGASPGGIYDEYGPVTLIASPVIRNTPNNCTPAGSVAGCSG